MTKRAAPMLVLALGAASTLYAHDMFIKLDDYFVEPNATVRVPVLNGTFELSENSITRDRVADISVVSPAGRTRVDTTAWTAVTDTSYLSLRTGGPGSYIVGVSTRPRDFSLEAADFNQYLALDGIPDVLIERAANRELDQPAWERYSKHIKAVVQVGDETTGAFDATLGYPAEIVPLENPYGLRAGDELRVRCLVDGEPVANQLVLAGGHATDGAIEERSARTDENGIARVVLDSPGRWYVKFINMRESPEADLDYESKWATLTFAIR